MVKFPEKKLVTPLDKIRSALIDFINIINLMSEHYNQTITSRFQNYVLLLNLNHKMFQNSNTM